VVSHALELGGGIAQVAVAKDSSIAVVRTKYNPKSKNARGRRRTCHVINLKGGRALSVE